MTTPDILLILGGVGILLTNIGGLVIQIITALKVAKVETHTNGMQQQLIASAKKEGAQEEKDRK